MTTHAGVFLDSLHHRAFPEATRLETGHLEASLKNMLKLVIVT